VYTLNTEIYSLTQMLNFSGRWYSKEIIMQALRLYLSQGCLIKIQRNKYTDWMLNALKQLFYGSYSCSQEVIGLC